MERQEEEAEQPFYVNAKQYHRILKRRIARAKIEESLKVARGRRPYLHESRHKHAMRRPRGQGGRFLTAAEIAEKEAAERNNSTATQDGENGATGESQKENSAGNEQQEANEASENSFITESASNVIAETAVESLIKGEYLEDKFN